MVVQLITRSYLSKQVTHWLEVFLPAFGSSGATSNIPTTNWNCRLTTAITLACVALSTRTTCIATRRQTMSRVDDGIRRRQGNLLKPIENILKPIENLFSGLFPYRAIIVTQKQKNCFIKPPKRRIKQFNYVPIRAARQEVIHQNC